MNHNFDKMVHDHDVRAMLDKQKEVAHLQRGLQDRQKEDKVLLGQIYQNQIDQKNKRLDNEHKMEKELEKMQIDRLKDPAAYDKLKKQAYQKEIQENLDQRKQMKQYEMALRENSVRESRKLMDDYARKEMINEQEYKNKFSRFDQGMVDRQKNYSNYVIKPTLEKQSKLDQIESKNMAEYNKKREENELGREAWRKAQLMNTSTEQRNQIAELSKQRMLDNEFRQIETKNTSERANEINTFDQMIKDDKKKRQDMYREMLSSQIQYNKGLKAMGNMTYVEKKLNKMDLRAYKNNGKVPEEKKNSSPKKQTYEEQQRRLDAYGYGRYISKAPSVNVIESYNGNSHSLERNQPAGQNMNNSYIEGAHPYHTVNQRDHSATPHSRRATNSTRADPSNRSLRNAGAISMSQEQRPAGSPSGVFHYRNQAL